MKNKARWFAIDVYAKSGLPLTERVKSVMCFQFVAQHEDFPEHASISALFASHTKNLEIIAAEVTEVTDVVDEFTH